VSARLIGGLSQRRGGVGPLIASPRASAAVNAAVRARILLDK